MVLSIKDRGNIREWVPSQLDYGANEPVDNRGQLGIGEGRLVLRADMDAFALAVALSLCSGMFDDVHTYIPYLYLQPLWQSL